MMNTLEPHGRGTAADLLIFELANARLRINRAELVLERAEEMLDADCGVGIKIALCSRIRSARRRVIDARSRLTKIKLAGTDTVRSAH